MMGDVLSWKTVHIPLWVKLVPTLRNAYAKRYFNSILEDRKRDEVDSKWMSFNVPISLVNSVSNIIKRECEWPSNLFFPEDDCEVVLWDSCPGLKDVNALLRIEKEVCGSTEISVASFSGLYRDLVLEVAVLCGNADLRNGS